MLRVLGIRLSLEHVVETRDAAAVLGRAAPFPTDVAWVGDVRFTWADVERGSDAAYGEAGAFVRSERGFLWILAAA
jgi:hypothetical protein